MADRRSGRRKRAAGRDFRPLGAAAMANWSGALPSRPYPPLFSHGSCSLAYLVYMYVYPHITRARGVRSRDSTTDQSPRPSAHPTRRRHHPRRRARAYECGAIDTRSAPNQPVRVYNIPTYTRWSFLCKRKRALLTLFDMYMRARLRLCTGMRMLWTGRVFFAPLFEG